MKNIWNKEVVVKRTIGGYIISNIIITLFISLITFLELFLGIKFLLRLNIATLVNIQNDASNISNLAFSISGGIMVYLIPLIIAYMALVTVLMIVYELFKNNGIKKEEAPKAKKKSAKKTTKSK